MAIWYTPTTIRADWADAKHVPIPRLEQLLEAAREQLLNHAPKPLPSTVDPASNGSADTIPATWREAQLLEVQAIWAETRTASGTDEDGVDGYVVRRSGPYQLGPGVMRLLRPFADGIA